MHIIICIDDNGGMLFNGRRQSQDRILREDILRSSAGKRLLMNAYSKKQFGEADAAILADEQFLDKAEPGDCCFVENLPVAPYIDRVESVTVYKWNRVYPADMYFDISMAAPEWRRTECTEFSGYSHEKITKEVYVR